MLPITMEATSAHAMARLTRSVTCDLRLLSPIKSSASCVRSALSSSAVEDMLEDALYFVARVWAAAG